MTKLPRHRYMPATLEHVFSRTVKVGECMEWQGGKWPRGYGKIMVNAKSVVVSRLVYELMHGGIPDGLLVCHSCDNPPCCNPEHLFLGDHQVNALDMASKGRQGFQRHPERKPIGERNGAYTHPESRRRGELNGCAKLTEAQVLEIRQRHAEGNIGYRLLAAEYGVSPSLIAMIVRREIWTYLE